MSKLRKGSSYWAMVAYLADFREEAKSHSDVRRLPEVVMLADVFNMEDMDVAHDILDKRADDWMAERRKAQAGPQGKGA